MSAAACTGGLFLDHVDGDDTAIHRYIPSCTRPSPTL